MISTMSTERLEIVKGHSNQVRYRDIIARRLLTQLRVWFPDNDSIFMNDEAFHTTKVLKRIQIVTVLECLTGLEIVRM